MKNRMKPLEAKSLKEGFIERFEELILLGRFKSGEKLPSERELARMLEVSRPVVHEGLVELAAKGLVTIIARRGTVVNDFRYEGSVEVLNSLLRYGAGELKPEILNGMLEMRMLFESETARLAALRRDEEELNRLEEALREEERVFGNTESRRREIAEADYRFHHAVAMAGGNIVYPMLINSFKTLYMNVLHRFYRHGIDLRPILENHRLIVEGIRGGDVKEAESQMRRLLRESAEKLNRVLVQEDEND